MTAWQTIRETPRRIGEAASQARPQLRGIISPPRRLSPVTFAVLVVGIVVSVPPDKVKELCIERGLLVLTAGKDVVRLLPPLVISDAEIDRGLAILRDVLDELSRS